MDNRSRYNRRSDGFGNKRFQRGEVFREPRKRAVERFLRDFSGLRAERADVLGTVAEERATWTDAGGDAADETGAEPVREPV